MSKPMDHIAYLSQEIGPRPAGTEEEQQAALYITERFQKETNLPVNIEDFTCSTDASLPKLICYIVTILATILALFVPVMAIPSIIIAVLSAIVFAAESFDKPVLSRLFMRGVSQNVVAKYEPEKESDGSGARRRKVILVAHYDSGKVRHDLAGSMPAIRRPLQYAVLSSMCALPVVLAIHRFLFAGEGVFGGIFMVLALIGAVIVAVPAVFTALEKMAAYNEGANSNAAGVAVMLEVARRISGGEAEGVSSSVEGVVHDEETARAAGVVPEGASLSYEVAPSQQADFSEEEIRKEDRAALNVPAPIDTLAAAAAKVTELQEAAEVRAQEEAARMAEEQTRLASGVVEEENTSGLPDWYIKATEKARKSEPVEASSSQYRSLYADFPRGPRVIEDVYGGDMLDGVQGIPGSAEVAPYEEDFSAEERIAEGEESELAIEEEASVSAEPVFAEATEESRVVEESPVEEPAPNVPDWYLRATRMRSDRDPHDFGDEVQTTDSAATAEAPAIAEEEVLEESESIEAVRDSEPAEGEVVDGATEAMPAVSDAGSLDLESLRAAAFEASEQGGSSVEEGLFDEESEDASIQVASEAQAEEVEEESEEAIASSSEKTQAMEPVETADAAHDSVDAVSEDEKEAVVPSSDVTAELPSDWADREEPAVPASKPAPPIFELPSIPSMDGILARGENFGVPSLDAHASVEDLPNITLSSSEGERPRSVSLEELKSRASLADADKSAVKEESASESVVKADESEKPSSSAMTAKMESIDLGKTEAFTPVAVDVAVLSEASSSEEKVSHEEGVRDANDSAAEEEDAEMQDSEKSDYVEMPHSRIERIFDKFRRKKKEDDKSAHEWLDVDDDFDARSAGKKRGGWESFRDEEDDWQGGAFDGLKARMARSADDEQEDSRSKRLNSLAVSQDAFASAFAAANAAAQAKGEGAVDEQPKEVEADIQQIYSFAAGDINTEVWFVALGSELANNGGIKAFLAEHASDMRGAVIVNLESLGAGTLSYLESEGELGQTTCSPRMKRFIRKASQATGIGVAADKVDWRESAASYARKHRMQSMTLAGMEDAKPAYYGQPDDIIENIDPEALDRSADIVIELLKNI